MNTEQWKSVPGHEGLYEVSNMGRVRSIVRTQWMRNRVLIPQGSPYLHVHIFNAGKRKAWRVHRLVASVFCGDLRPGLTVNHIDGNKKNNVATNLQICTQAENNVHALQTGLRKVGSSVKNSKLKEADIPVIRRRLLDGETLLSVASSYGVCLQNISNIKRGLSWRHIQEVAASAKAA